MKFFHALTAIKFAVGNNLDINKTISKVELLNVYGHSIYKLQDNTNCVGSWTNDTPSNFTLSDLNFQVSPATAVNTTFVDGNNTFLMIPQKLPQNASVRITFTDGATINAKLQNDEGSAEWKAGTTRTYKINNNPSSWTFTISSTSTASLTATDEAANYSVEGYQTFADGTRRAVPWKIVGYSTDDGKTFTEGKPDWISAVSLTSGNGAATAANKENGVVSIPSSLTDHVAEINNALKNAPQVTDYDLSKDDGKNGNQTTANSYLISAAGSYKLPLVFGNALKNGQTNNSSFHTNNTGEYVLPDFLDAYGNNITQPYINQAGHKATQAKIVWMDETGLVSNITVTDDYLTFDVPQSNIKQGNAVIAVQDAGGHTLWSWHIWVAPKDVLSTIHVTNAEGTDYNMSRDAVGQKYLKWTGTSYDSRNVIIKFEQTKTKPGEKAQTALYTITQIGKAEKQATSTLYQWGRKDAFPTVDLAGNDIQGAEMTLNYNAGLYKGDVKSWISNPNNFYVWENNNSIHIFYNLWDSSRKDLSLVENKVVKTVYDPSPRGFKMPAGKAYTRFILANVVGEWSGGFAFSLSSTTKNSIFFLSAGARNFDKSQFQSKQLGFYWTSAPSGAANGKTFMAGKSIHGRTLQVNPNEQYSCSYGLSIHPVLDE